MTCSDAHRKFDLYWQLAFAAVVLVVFAEFLWTNRVGTGAPWQVVLVFAFGALYAALGVLGLEGCGGKNNPRAAALYFVVQCALATAIVLITPLKGFSGIITMPIASMAVLCLSWPWAALVVAELFAACIIAITIAFGLSSGLQSASSYGIAFAFTVVFSVVTRRAQESRDRSEQLAQELAAANEQLRRYAEQAGELATTRERNRLAREIHDGLGHYLTTINVQLEAARAVLAGEPARAADALATAARLSRDALEDIRRSVGTLRADAPHPPLPESLRALAHNLGLSVAVQVRGDPRPLPPAVEHALYRSAQEGLTNVLKHATAERTDLTLDYRDAARVVLTVSDNGRGPGDGNNHAAPAGYGLRGIRERVDLLGGSVSTGGAAGGGFVLTIDVPA